MAKWLIQKFPQKGIGRIFAYTKSLAVRNDMAIFDDDPPKSMVVHLNNGQPEKEKFKPVPYKVSSEFSNRGSYACLPPETPSLPGSASAATAVLTAVPEETTETAMPEIAMPETVSDEPGGETAPNLIPTYTPEQKMEKLVKAIGSFKAGSEEHFTTQGLPRVDALILALDGCDVTTPERDKAWKLFNGKGRGKGK
jgi:hypothetical protein